VREIRGFLMPPLVFAHGEKGSNSQAGKSFLFPLKQAGVDEIKHHVGKLSLALTGRVADFDFVESQVIKTRVAAQKSKALMSLVNLRRLRSSST
jgi:hypothetical protein